jgi:hypothetical protein
MADIDYYKAYTNSQTLTDNEEAQITILLEEAQIKILNYTLGNWSDPNDVSIPPSTVIADNLQCRMVYRYFENQLGVTTESLDGWSYSVKTVQDGIQLTDSDKLTLIDANIKVSDKSVIITYEQNRNGGWPF